jgi:hypothetical protein
MSTYDSLSHSTWDCKYCIVFVPKGRKKDPATTSVEPLTYGRTAYAYEFFRCNGARCEGVFVMPMESSSTSRA